MNVPHWHEPHWDRNIQCQQAKQVENRTLLLCWIGPVWSHEDGSSTSLLCVCVNCDCFRLFTDVQPSGSNSVSWTEAPTHFVLRCYSNAVIKFQSVSAGSQERHFIYCLQVTSLRKEKKKNQKTSKHSLYLSKSSREKLALNENVRDTCQECSPHDRWVHSSVRLHEGFSSFSLL